MAALSYQYMPSWIECPFFFLQTVMCIFASLLRKCIHFSLAVKRKKHQYFQCSKMLAKVLLVSVLKSMYNDGIQWYPYQNVINQCTRYDKNNSTAWQTPGIVLRGKRKRTRTNCSPFHTEKPHYCRRGGSPICRFWSFTETSRLSLCGF